MTQALCTSSISQASVSSSDRSECCAEYQLREVMTPKVWYSVHHSQFPFCLRFFDITLMSFYCVFFSFLGIDVTLGIFSCIQRRLSFPFFPFSRTVCLVSSEGSHDPRGLVPDISFAFHLVSFLEWHYADEPFLDFSNFVPSHPTPVPPPASPSHQLGSAHG